jgi:hypothetical protein
MIVIYISILTIIAMVVGFKFGRGYERERWMPKPKVLNLRPSEWRRTS